MNRKLSEIAAANEIERQRLLEGVEGLSQEQLDFRPSADEWSIGEILNHLNILERRVAVLFGRKAAEAKEAGLGPDLTEGSVLNCLDGLPIEEPVIKIKAPNTVIPESGIEKRELLDCLAESRKNLLNAMQALSAYDLSKLIQAHPIFGDWNLYQWMLAIGKHEHRHLVQINCIKSISGFPASTAATTV